jgi:hypothetical protein
MEFVFAQEHNVMLIYAENYATVLNILSLDIVYAPVAKQQVINKSLTSRPRQGVLPWR